VLGPRVHGIFKDRIGAPRSNEDGRPGGFYIPRFRNLDDKSKAKDFIRGYGLEGSSGQEMFPEDAVGLPGFGQAYKKKVRDHAGAFLYMYGLGEVLPRYENHVALDPQVKDSLGIPVLRFSYRYGDNEKKMCADMVTSMQEAFDACGFEITRVDRDPLTEGSSVHELGTARMGADAKTSVVNPFQQTHDVKNLFVVDGATFVSAANQNPTWTIMALCWRSCDYLAEELRRGNL
jgi:choline dehydrogenase-like flavoprotein